MDVRIQIAGHAPIYQQIVEQIGRLMASGRLARGERLPSVRSLAEQLVVNPNTVARAYRELERQGAVFSRQGDGVFVAEISSPFGRRERRRMLLPAIDRLLTNAAQLGIEAEELAGLIRERARRGRGGGSASSRTAANGRGR